MVYRQCDCRGPCEHWTIDIRHKGTRTKGTAATFGHVLVGHQKLPRTLREAKDFEAQVKAWVVKGKPDPTPPSAGPADTSLTVHEVIEVYKEKQLGKTDDKAAASIIKYLDQDLGERPMVDLLNPDLLEDYKDDCIEEGLSETTTNRYLSYVSILINFAVGQAKQKRWSFSGDSPFYHQVRNPQGVKKFREGHRAFRLWPGDEDLLLKAIDQLPGDNHWVQNGGEMMRGRFYCAIETGLRRGEMLKTEREDILWHHKDGLMIRVQWGNAKSRKERLVPVLSQRLTDFLKSRRMFRYPFGAEDGTYQESFRKQWEAVLENVAALMDGDERLADLRWHDLRHECGSRWAEGWNGRQPVPLHEVQLLMGHAKLTTTQKYLNAQLSGLTGSMKRAMGL